MNCTGLEKTGKANISDIKVFTAGKIMLQSLIQFIETPGILTRKKNNFKNLVLGNNKICLKGFVKFHTQFNIINGGGSCPPSFIQDLSQ